jgi:muconate cycloisomerase
MDIRIELFTVHKRFPLTISRGTATHNTNVWVVVTQDGFEGWGEGVAFSIGEATQTTEAIAQSLQAIQPHLVPFSPSDREAIARCMANFHLPSAARTAVDMACHDWLGKRASLPTWQLLGGDRQRIVPISVTIGIQSPENARQRLQHWQQMMTVKAVKIKLGNPSGITADQAMFQALQQDIREDVQVSVDANGGWTVEDAQTMLTWLADYNIAYVEQPLPRGQEEDLLSLYRRSPLPIMADESCFTSADIPHLADRVHGINIKLMKSGGLTEALRMVHTAQACGLKIMFGCYSDSALANTAALQLAPFADYLDLDSHLNLVDDPFIGVPLQDGCLLLNDQPGLGVQRHSNGAIAPSETLSM